MLNDKVKLEGEVTEFSFFKSMSHVTCIIYYMNMYSVKDLIVFNFF